MTGSNLLQKGEWETLETGLVLELLLLLASKSFSFHFSLGPPESFHDAKRHRLLRIAEQPHIASHWDGENNTSKELPTGQDSTQ